MMKDTREDQVCHYPSNPGPVCAEACSRRPSVRFNVHVEGFAAPNRGESKEKGEKGEGKRNVNPLCVNASNPYHQCAEYCARKRLYESQPSKGAKSVWWSSVVEAGKKNSCYFPFAASEESEEGMQVTDTRKSKPSCHYAANPYHQCSKYCAQRINEIDEKTCSSPGLFLSMLS
ncbi:hypothetical protein HPP92_025660 [Vanilla planifolia]|uniref:Uncharacterized protein n=1 Tax=Vanilla planifolia TaxID=51239 RepID=A0A835PIA2_VANPL|nr:hypothetical protein HPP92_025660 [Vanilla planifolia]